MVMMACGSSDKSGFPRSHRILTLVSEESIGLNTETNESYVYPIMMFINLLFPVNGQKQAPT